MLALLLDSLHVSLLSNDTSAEKAKARIKAKYTYSTNGSFVVNPPDYSLSGLLLILYDA